MAQTGIASLARIGGLSRAARYDGLEVTQAARDTFRRSFREGHGCKVCPRIDLPVDLSETERDRRAEALRRLHFERLNVAAARKRAEKKAEVHGNARPPV